MIHYRDQWTARITEIKRKADEFLLVQKQVGAIAAASKREVEWEPPGELELAVYIESIPETLQRAYDFAQPEWDKGVNAFVREATYQVIKVAERLWIGLSTRYPPTQFGGRDAAEFISQYIAGRYELRHALMEPEGPGTGGTMMPPMIAYGVLLDVQELILLTVRMMVTFSTLHEKVDLEGWRERFARATSGYRN